MNGIALLACQYSFLLSGVLSSAIRKKVEYGLRFHAAIG